MLPTKNLNALFKLNLYEQDITLSKMEERINLDKGYLSRVFNNHYQIRKERNLIKICNYLHLDYKHIYARDSYFEKMTSDFFEAFLFRDPTTNLLYEQILQYKSQFKQHPYRIDIMMVEFVHLVSLAKPSAKLDSLVEQFYKIEASLNPTYRKLFLVFLLDYLQLKSKLEDILNIFRKAHQIQLKDKTHELHIQGFLYYYGMTIFRKLNRFNEVKRCFFESRKCFRELGNYVMEMNLNMKYSGFLRMSGHLEKALSNDLNILKMLSCQNNERLKNKEILYNNIAWTYSLMHDYNKAIIYYHRALETLQDNEIYFNLAYCYYKTNKKQEALLYIEKGRQAKFYVDYAYLLLDWLEAMIQRKYSKKSYILLIKFLKIYGKDVEKSIRDFIQIEIANYLYFTKQYEDVLYACHELLNRKIISPSELALWSRT